MFLLFRLPNVALVRKTDAVCSRMFQVRVLVFLDLDFLVETIGWFEAIFLADISSAIVQTICLCGLTVVV